jgi:hypothetical protein
MRKLAGRLALAAKVALCLPVFALGLHDDDFFHRLALSGRVAEFHKDQWSLYEFIPSAEARRLIDAGLLPWFSDPELRTRFFRPLSSASLALDVRWFGNWALPAYLHSLLWFGLVLALVTRIHRAILPERAAFWASLTFGIAGAHAASISWIAARHVLVSGAFGLGAFAVSLSRRSTGDRAALACGLTAAALVAGGLFASEAALAAVALLLAEPSLRPGPTRRERWLRGLPVAAVSIVYLAWYSRAGYGTHGMGSYVNPLETPGRFAITLADRVPLLMTEAFTGVPCALLHLGPVAHSVLWGLGIAAALAIGLGFRRASRETKAALGWIPVGFLGALVPVAGAIIDGRVLLVPMVASSMLLGVVIADRAGGAILPRLGRVVVLVLALGISPLARVAVALANENVSRIEAAIVPRSKIRCPEGGRVFVVNGADPAVGMYSGPLFALSGVRWSGWHVLSLAPNDLELERRGPRSFVLRTLGPRKTNEFEALYRASPPAPGTRVRVRGLLAEVERSSDLGATQVRFELDTELDSSCLARWKGGADGYFESLSLPASGVVKLLHEPGPLGF